MNDDLYTEGGREMRDEEDSCDHFTTSPSLRVFRDCMGDGHYMCRSCLRYKPDDKLTTFPFPHPVRKR